MANLPIYGLGTSRFTSLPIYGFGIGQAPIIDILSGTIRGGDEYALLGSGIVSLHSIDTFNGALNTDVWTNVSSGGTASSGSGLSLSVPKTGGTAAIQSTAGLSFFDITVHYTYDNSIEQLNPTANIIFCELIAKIDSNTSATLQHQWKPGTGSTMRFIVTSNGTTLTDEYIISSSSARQLRMVRNGGQIQGWVGSNLISDFDGWTSSTSTITVGASCTTSPKDIITTITSYTPSSLVVFGNVIAPQVTEYADGVITGLTPPADLPGGVMLTVYPYVGGLQHVDGQYSYVAPLQLTISEASASGNTIIVDNDDTLRDSDTNLPGLRL